MITLVTPMHVYTAGADAAGPLPRRTLAVAGRLVITLPSPSLLAGELTAAGVLAALGFRRRRVATRVAQRR